jgi:hypothetical protein
MVLRPLTRRASQKIGENRGLASVVLLWAVPGKRSPLPGVTLLKAQQFPAPRQEMPQIPLAAI